MDQRQRRDFDDGRGGRDAANGCAGDALGEQTDDEFVGKPAQLVRGHGAGDHNVCHAVRPLPAPYLGIFGVFGQVVRRVHGQLYVFGGLRHVPPGFELHPDAGGAFGGGGGGVGHTFNRQ